MSIAPLEEHTCLIPLNHLGVLHISGNDAKTFLQGQITCNVDDVNKSRSLLGAHCNLKGRMQSLFRIFQSDSSDSYYLVMPQSMLNLALSSFKKYALFSKVSFEINAAMIGLGLYGKQSKETLIRFFPDVAQLGQPYDSLITETTSSPYFISLVPGQHLRYEIWGNNDSMNTLQSNLSAHCKVVSGQMWELLEIQAGIPTIYPQTVDLILPHHANLSILNGISYTKGCYLGQEIIARMQYRGKIKKHLYRAYIQEGALLPPPGTQVKVGTQASEPGVVLRSAVDVSGNIELLVVLDDEFNHFENVSLNLADEPKVHRLDLPYTW